MIIRAYRTFELLKPIDAEFSPLFTGKQRINIAYSSGEIKL